MGIFNSAIFNNAIFNTTGAQGVQTRGGIPIDVERYRKQLREIAEAADKRLYKNVRKQIKKLAEQAPEEIAEIAREIQVEIDFSALAKTESQSITLRLYELLAKFEAISKQFIIGESEDELIILMAIP